MKPFFLIAAIFFYIFSPRINFYTEIHSGFFIVISIFIIYSIKYKNNYNFIDSNLIKYNIIVLLYLFCYNLFICFFNDNNSFYLSSIFISIIVSIIFGWLICHFISSMYSLTEIELLDLIILFIVICISLNSIIILFEYLFPSFRVILESIFTENTSIDYSSSALRFRGFSASGGAGLSVLNAISILLIFYLSINNRIKFDIGFILILVNTTATVFIGRTGLIFSLIFTFIFFISPLFFNYKYTRFKYLFYLLLILLVIYILNNFQLDSEIYNDSFEWVDGLKYGELKTSSSDDLFENHFHLPDNIFDIILGIGLFEGDSTLRSDSGYMKSILSIGLINSLILYFCLIFNFLQLNKISHNYKFLVYPILFFMLAIEVKEPFIYQNFASRVLFLLSGATFFLLNNINVNKNNTCNYRA